MRPRLSSSVVGLFAASGCASGWQLTLDPAHFPNQRPVAPDERVTLVVRDETDVRFVPLGTGADRRWVLEDADPLEGDRLGLLIQAPGADPGTYDPSALRAWGESAPVVGQDGELVASLMVAAFGAPGSLRSIDDGAAFGAAATTADGTTWLFGGSGLAHGALRRLDDPDGGARGFVRAGDLPDDDDDGTPDPTVRAAAVALPDDTVLVVGGGSTRTSRTDAAALFDPAATKWRWRGAMTRHRAGHLAWARDDGTVVIVGGDAEAAPTWEVFADDRFEDRGTLPLGPDGLAGASTAAGILVCGGRAIEPVATCVLLDESGVRPAASLPIALHGHTLVGLSDGRVLAAGGFIGACPTEGPCWASPRAFVYGPADAWTEVGPMNRPRGGAAAVPTQDGRAVIFGGAESMDPVTDPVVCAEVFDGAAFTGRGPCHAALGGRSPAVGFHPDHGAVVVRGYTEEEDGGVDVAFVSTGPPAAVVNGAP